MSETPTPETPTPETMSLDTATPGPVERETDMIVHGLQPYNAEPTLDRLCRSFVTPLAAFYVRSHGAVPMIDASTYRLIVDGRVARRLELSLGDLRERFETVTVAATLQCAGNRRADLDALRPVSGDPWTGGAIGNAAWTGVRLGDVLRAAGLREEGLGEASFREAGLREGGLRKDGDLHVAFSSHDIVEAADESFAYGASIGLGKALSAEVILAWAMNGEDLSPEHGFPLRAVVPGFAGVRSAKWLHSVTVQDAPSDAPIQATDYKLFPPDIAAETADWDEGATIDAMPVNSAICVPAAAAALPVGRVTVRGWAVASGRAIARVDVSRDGGRTWRQATLQSDAAKPWSWTLWSLDIDLSPGEHELAVRAWDSAGQTQPAHREDVWNFKGYLSSAWHRVGVRAG